MKSVCVLFRKELGEDFGSASESEFSICSKHMHTVEFRSDVENGSLVIGRYSVLPFYKELEREVLKNGGILANSHQQHEFIADVMNWSSILGDMTPRSWTTWGGLPEGRYVLKGKTNSRKFQWNTHMFASCRDDIPIVASRLLDDSLVREQGVVVREYVPLIKVGEGINGIPISKEYRLFFWKDRLLCSGFYWSSMVDDGYAYLVPPSVKEFASKVAVRIMEHANFFVLDVALRQSDGSPILIEVNDGQMSGLSGCDPDELYLNLSRFASE